MSYTEDPELRQSLHRWKVVGVISLFALVILFPLSRAVEASNRVEATSSMQSSAVSMGKEIYASNCAKCHGDQGQGVDSPALNSKQFLDVTTAEHIYRLASVGVPGTAMPAWSEDLGGPLTDEQLRAVGAYIMSWAPDAPDVPDWRTKFLGTPPPMPMGGGQMEAMPGMDHSAGTGGMANMPGMDAHTNHDHTKAGA
jgi:mono/diheme cytochrome c family protein